MQMVIRPYQPTDADALLAIFRQHVLAAFAPGEESDFQDFLQNLGPLQVQYAVAEQNGAVAGACGHHITPDGQTARICWVLTAPGTTGVGRALVADQVAAIGQHPTVQVIECRTSQVAYRFFEKFGFQLQHTQSDYWAEGFDLYFMTKEV